MINKYVAGFLFDDGGNSVLLLKKARPAWQFGRFNGIGGKIESGETSFDAMVRECREEIGLTIAHWKEFVILKGRDWQVHFFKAYDNRIAQYIQMEDEVPAIFNVNNL